MESETRYDKKLLFHSCNAMFFFLYHSSSGKPKIPNLPFLQCIQMEECHAGECGGYRTCRGRPRCLELCTLRSANEPVSKLVHWIQSVVARVTEDPPSLILTF